ncbi:MAG: hypothetical protein WCS27_00355 [Victivallaceae bacterium]
MKKTSKKWTMLLLLAFLPVLCNATHFSYNQGDIECPVGSGGVSYTLSVSISKLGASGYSFDTRAGVTTGSPSRISISGSFSGTIAYGLTELPTSDVAMSMNGKLIGSGGSGGTQPTWSASANAVAPFYVSPKEQVVVGGAPIVHIDASDNANWSMGSYSESDSDCVVIEGLDTIFTNTWSVANGTYSVTATKVGGTASDTASFTICQHGSEWGNDTGTISIDIPTAGIQKVNTLINYIPGININLDTGSATASRTSRVYCCDNGTEMKEFKDIKSFSVGKNLSSNPIPIPIPGLPTGAYGFEVGDTNGSFYLAFEATIGVWINPGAISVGVSQEKITNQCNQDICLKSTFSSGWDPSLNGGIQSTACLQTIGFSDCAEVTATLTLSTGVEIGFTHKTDGCETPGWSGVAKLQKGEVAVKVVVTGIGSYTSPSLTLWDECNVL